MLQIAWQKEANQIIEISQSGTEFHNESNSGNRKSVEYVRPGRFLLSFGWQAMTKPSINLASCSIWHEASLQKLHPFIVMSTITIVFNLQQNILFYNVYYTDLKLTWFDCFQKIMWLVESQTIKDVLNFAPQKCIFIINLKWFVSAPKHVMRVENVMIDLFPTRKMAYILCTWRMGNINR